MLAVVLWQQSLPPLAHSPTRKRTVPVLAIALQAIDDFLKAMKLTLQDMKQRPALAAAVVGYHGELGHRPSSWTLCV